MTRIQSLLLALSIFINPIITLADPIKVHPANPRYFIHDGQTVYLIGHQISLDLQDPKSCEKPFNWQNHLNWMKQRNINYVRNWTWWSMGSNADKNPNCTRFPLMYKRTGPGNAIDGKPKFNLERFEQAFFDRMRTRVMQAEAKEVYISIMLFEVYSFYRSNSQSVNESRWGGNPFRGANNVNGVNALDEDNKGCDFFYTSNAKIRNLQKAYVKKVIDTLNEFDNVIYEIANELYAPNFQNDMANYIKSHEASKPKQHLVYLSHGGRSSSCSWKAMTESQVINSPADIYAPSHNWNGFPNNPPMSAGTKPAVWDVDHIFGDHWEDPKWAWTAFTRGYHFCLYDNEIWESTQIPTSAYERMRYNMGAILNYANAAINLAAMNPRNDLSSTGFCLANPGMEYIIYQPGSSSFTIKGLSDNTEYSYQWFNTDSYSEQGTGTITTSGSSRSFSPPFSKAVLVLKYGSGIAPDTIPRNHDRRKP